MTLAVVDNQLVRLEPVLDHQGGFFLSASFNPENPKEGALILMCAAGCVEAGVRYYVMHEDTGLDVTLDKERGSFVVEKGYGLVKFRAVAGTQAWEAELVVQP